MDHIGWILVLRRNGLEIDSGERGSAGSYTTASCYRGAAKWSKQITRGDTVILVLDGFGRKHPE
jgi:hypothetical protein